MTLEVDGTRKTWWDCVKADMKILGLSQENTQSGNKWRIKIKPASFGIVAAKRCVYMCEIGAADASAHISKTGQCRSCAAAATPWSNTRCGDQGSLHPAACCCQGGS